MKKKKVKTRKEIELEFLEQQLKMTKDTYETYIEVLVKYNNGAVAYTAIRAEEQLQRTLKIKLEQTREDLKAFHKFMFGDGKKLNEIEILERDIKHFNSLIDMTKLKIKNSFDHKTKVKIAKDSIEKSQAWMNIDLDELKKIKEKKD